MRRRTSRPATSGTQWQRPVSADWPTGYWQTGQKIRSKFSTSCQLASWPVDQGLWPVRPIQTPFIAPHLISSHARKARARRRDMNIRSNTVLRAAIVSVGVFGVAGAALAGPPSWARDHGRFERDSDYARVVNVDPIVHRVRVSTPEKECWSEDRPVYNEGSGTVARSTLI